jgi:glycosidase
MVKDSSAKKDYNKNLNFVGRVLEVVWVDSMVRSGWNTFNHDDNFPLDLITSWGRLMKEDEESLHLAGDYLPDINGINPDVNRIIRIPKGCIKQVTPLRG